MSRRAAGGLPLQKYKKTFLVVFSGGTLSGRSGEVRRRAPQIKNHRIILIISVPPFCSYWGKVFFDFQMNSGLKDELHQKILFLLQLLDGRLFGVLRKIVLKKRNILIIETQKKCIGSSQLCYRNYSSSSCGFLSFFFGVLGGKPFQLLLS